MLITNWSRLVSPPPSTEQYKLSKSTAFGQSEGNKCRWNQQLNPDKRLCSNSALGILPPKKIPSYKCYNSSIQTYFYAYQAEHISNHRIIGSFYQNSISSPTMQLQQRHQTIFYCSAISGRLSHPYGSLSSYKNINFLWNLG